MLGRMFDGIEFRGFAQESVEILGEFAGVPVWNGLTDTWHPTQMLADMLTMRDHAGKPLAAVTYCYLGDGRNNTANSLLVTGAMLGHGRPDLRPGAAAAIGRGPEIARALAARSGAGLTISADVTTAVAGADFLYTDVWLSMGEPAAEWDERIDQLLPYQVNAEVMAATGNPAVKFLHCLPALHNRETQIGQQIYDQRGLAALEVTDEVFESPASIVFDQAENRMHTIKAAMVATIPPGHDGGMRVVVALGGNALLERGERPDSDIQESTSAGGHGARPAGPPAMSWSSPTATGPQVGLLALESARDTALTASLSARRARRPDPGHDRVLAGAGAAQRGPGKPAHAWSAGRWSARTTRRSPARPSSSARSTTRRGRAAGRRARLGGPPGRAQLAPGGALARAR